MGKILFWALVIIGGLMLARVLARYHERSRLNDDNESARPVKGLKTSTSSEPESMVRCEHCGIHLPRSEAVLSGGRTWCSQEHSRLGTRQ